MGAAAMNMTIVAIDPDGTQDWGVFVIADSPTGTTYEVQCGGHSTEQRSAEGYLVPVGDAAAARPLQDFFARAFGGNPPPAGGNRWSDTQLDELAGIVGQLPYWSRSQDGSDQRSLLKLNRERVSELTEAWIPVEMLGGAGILIFKNSD
jgi:Family of unknown function (DUF6210)